MNATTITSIAFASLSLLVAAVASADTTEKAGTKGHVTAYEADKKTVIRVDACPTKKLAFDYPTCGKALRDDIHDLMCKRGKGTHKWWYQIADGKPMEQAAACK